MNDISLHKKCQMFRNGINKHILKMELYKMRIEILLNETQFLPSTDTVSFSSLTPIQINVLRKLNDGLIEYETATPREQLTIDELEDLGLVVQGMISPAGEKMVGVSDSEGYSSYAKEAGLKDRLNKRSDIGGRRTSDQDFTSRADPLDTADAQSLRF